MLKINVFQRGDELLEKVLHLAFKECDKKVVFGCSNDLSIFTTKAGTDRCSSRIVIAPDSKYINTDASEIITYGLCCKNTLTVSSCIENDMIVSLQRSVFTLNGNTVEVQDFPVRISDHDEPEVVLATVAALMVCDVPIKKISSLAF